MYLLRLVLFVLCRALVDRRNIGYFKNYRLNMIEITLFCMVLPNVF